MKIFTTLIEGFPRFIRKSITNNYLLTLAFIKSRVLLFVRTIRKVDVLGSVSTRMELFIKESSQLELLVDVVDRIRMRIIQHSFFDTHGKAAAKSEFQIKQASRLRVFSKVNLLYGKFLRWEDRNHQPWEEVLHMTNFQFIFRVLDDYMIRWDGRWDQTLRDIQDENNYNFSYKD